MDIVGVGGAVQASPSGKSPPMGNGHLPSQDDNESARVRHLDIVNSNFKVKGSDKYKLEKLLDNNKCYGLKDGNKVGFFQEPVLFTYGGLEEMRVESNYWLIRINKSFGLHVLYSRILILYNLCIKKNSYLFIWFDIEC